jgi:hypothetical protein
MTLYVVAFRPEFRLQLILKIKLITGMPFSAIKDDLAAFVARPDTVAMHGEFLLKQNTYPFEAAELKSQLRRVGTLCDLR